MSAGRPFLAGAQPPRPDGPPEARVIRGDAVEVLAGLPPAVAQTCVTSPPYWGLRDYGVAPRVWAGDGPPCRRHRWEAVDPRRARSGKCCGRCGAWKGCLGLEPDPGLYVEHLIAVMRAVHRVLRPDGSLWLNLGDTYALRPTEVSGHGPPGPGSVKPKDLIGIPWRVALALQAEGWYLRSDVIWAKSNLTPEPTRDRPAHTHEHVLLLAPSRRYLYDSFAVREPATGGGLRNRRSVWALPTARFAGAHFASFPEALAEPCVLAGSSPLACRYCGAPWRRVVRSRRLLGGREVRGNWGDPAARLLSGRAMRRGERHSKVEVRRETVGWEPSCDHDEPGSRSLVLDPFCGTGTTGRVAVREGRDFLGVELSAEYARLARRRIAEAHPPEAPGRVHVATGDASGVATGDVSAVAPAPGEKPGTPRPVRRRDDRRSPKSSPDHEVRS